MRSHDYQTINSGRMRTTWGPLILFPLYISEVGCEGIPWGTVFPQWTTLLSFFLVCYEETEAPLPSISALAKNETHQDKNTVKAYVAALQQISSSTFSFFFFSFFFFLTYFLHRQSQSMLGFLRKIRMEIKPTLYSRLERQCNEDIWQD